MDIQNSGHKARAGKAGRTPMALTQAKTLMHPESDNGRMIGGILRECLGGFAACGLLRKKIPQSSTFSRPERMSLGCALVSDIEGEPWELTRSG